MPPREANVITRHGSAIWYILSINISKPLPVMPAVFMPEIGKIGSTFVNRKMKISAITKLGSE